MDIRYEVHDAGNIDLDGRYVIVSNHPLGGLDGLILISYFSKTFPGRGLKVLTNDFLMAERLKEKLLEHPAVDLVAGPDSYRDLPKLVSAMAEGGSHINTLLSHTETYADISPVRMNDGGVSGFISIMRGCNNVCSYCIVPYVRGSERSRDPRSIVREACEMFEAGYREVNLLGQNVDSYLYEDNAAGSKVTFANLLEMVAAVDPALRVRFATSHPKDMSDEVLYAMAKHPNICKHIHLPVQSGSNEVLEKMNRKYTVETYLQRIAKIREVLPECGITTDVIVGFCGETADDFQKTLDLFRLVGYDWAFMSFTYCGNPSRSDGSVRFRAKALVAASTLLPNFSPAIDRSS
jgi:radical SAM methylthiotransferase, MiaB/RimO family